MDFRSQFKEYPITQARGQIKELGGMTERQGTKELTFRLFVLLRWIIVNLVNRPDGKSILKTSITLVAKYSAVHRNKALFIAKMNWC